MPIHPQNHGESQPVCFCKDSSYAVRTPFGTVSLEKMLFSIQTCDSLKTGNQMKNATPPAKTPAVLPVLRRQVLNPL